ncbi:T9SS type A sorting domain-containing protein [Hymenobacter cheonanensis]|uniref:T9SS type A sorting domain-containing protein n=1 Tax=Hymenobacter sp. CA2-7 TaxID=3063993 RepID=UPI002729D048|nr:T9SS type A sorting domain-containing protein [Hymenobacter sp. CA2-7]
MLPLLAQAQLKITQAATPTTESFDGMNTAATVGTAATLPTGFQLTPTATTAAPTPVYGASGNTTVTTQSTTYKNNFTTGGSYNFGDGGTNAASATDRALGFLPSSGAGAGLPRSILVAIQNTTSSSIQDLQVKFDLEQYRIASATNTYAWSFFSSTDGAAWTSRPDGDQSFAANAAASSSNPIYYYPPNVTNKVVTLSGVNLASGSTLYLRWTMSGSSSTSAQAIGLDNLVLTPTLGTGGGGSTTPTASLSTTASAYASPYCVTSNAGSTAFNVAFTSSNVAAGSTYAAQLSDASGSFSTDLTQNLIGSGNSSPISASIPAGTPSGSGYRIRVVSGTLASANNNGTDIVVTLAPSTNPVTLNSTAAQVFTTNTSGTALTAKASVASTYAWYYGTSTGTYATAISGATSATYQPKGSDFPGAGTYYLVARATSNCGAVVGTSDPVQLTISPAATAFTLSATSLPDFGSVAVGSTSAVKSFSVSATSLTGPLVITPPAGFEIRTGATAFACCAITLTPDANGNVPATTIDVRFAPLAAQPYSAQVALTTSGLSEQDVAVTGTGIAPIYPAAVASIAPSNVGKTSATAGGTVTDEGGSPVTSRGVVYGFGPDPTVSSGSVAAGSGLGTFTTQLTGLLPDSVYYVRAYATNALGTSYGEQFTFTTQPQPLDAEPTTPSIIAVSNQRPTRVLLTFSGGQPGVKHLVLARLNGPVAVKPQDATAYTASPVFGQGQLLGTASYVVLSAAQDTVTIKGLRPNTPYSFAVYDYQDLNGTPYAQNYLTSAADSLTLTTPALPPTLLLREDFEYAAGTALTANGWTAHSTGSNTINVATGSLTYAGYSDGKGNSAALRASGEDVSRQFTTVYPRTAVYLSFVVTVSSVNTTGDYFLHLGPTTLSSNFRPRVFVRQAASGNAIQFGVSDNGAAVYTTATYSLNTPYLLLVKYSFDETGSTSELYVNPDPKGSSVYRVSATPDVSVSGTTSPSDIGTLALRQGTSSPALVVDDIQLATAFPLTTTPLPVTLTQFTAQAQGRGVQLAWQTASEVNSDHFVVERSLDGRTFSPLQTVPAAGSSSTPRTYAALDTQAQATGATQLYYRLRSVDHDGTSTYSSVQAVMLAPAASGLALFPNPIAGGATTLMGASAGARVQVLDALGRVVATATADAAGTAHLTLPAGVASGVYVVRTGAQALRLLVN